MDIVEVIAKNDQSTWVRVMAFASTFNNYVSYIVAVRCIGEENRNVRGKSQQITDTHNVGRIHLAMNGIRTLNFYCVDYYFSYFVPVLL